MDRDGTNQVTGRVLPLKGSEHTAIDALLPFYVNGTLQGGELDRVKQHLAGCEQCRREVDWLRDVFAACTAVTPIPDAAPFAEAGGIPALAGRIEPRGWRSRMSAGWQSTQPWVRMLIAAQFACVAVLGTLHVSEMRDDAPYRTLGASTRSTALFSHIHFGQPGVAGGVAAFLCGGGTKPACTPTQGMFEGDIVASDVVGPTGQGIAPGEFDELITAMKKGYTYANVHTTLNPAGLIRGQIHKGSGHGHGEGGGGDHQ